MPPKKSDTFKKGEKIRARWSGSNTFYDAKVLDVFVKTCKVEFSDGTISNVKLGDIKSEKTEKEPTPKRTRSRSRSVGRPRSRSRSPGRTEKKKTATKNEKKTPKNKVEERSNQEESPNTTNSIKKDETDSIMVKSSLTREKIGSLKEEIKASVSSFTTTNSISSKNLYVSLEKEDPAEMRLRSSRQSTLRSADISSEVKKSYEKSNATGKMDSGKYSDDEESDEEIEVIVKQPSKVLKVFAFLATFLKIILMPSCLLFLAFACTKRQCTVLEPPQFYSRFKDLVNALKVPLPCVILFHLSICLLSLIPLGKKVTGFPYGPKKTVKEYRINGFITLILSVIIFGLCSYFEVNMNWGYEKIRPLAISIALYCALYSLVLQVVSLIHGEREKESTVPILGSFFNGVYFNPFIFGKVDIKTTFIRAGFIGTMLISMSILMKFFLMRGYIPVPLAVSAGMLGLFVLDYFVREEKMLSTATYTSDSVGYGFIMTTGFLIPIGLNLPLVYLFIFESNADLIPHWCSAAMVALFVVGYYIYMSSGNLKHNFRSNPFSPSLSDVDSMPTSQKKRLISSKLWGLVRHPNYLGLILMATAWTLPCGFTHFTPYGPLVLLIISLILRCIRVESECKEKYGPAWNNYTEKVQSRLIPYIF